MKTAYNAFQTNGNTREDTASFWGRELLAKYLSTGPPTEELQRVFDDALDATTDYVWA
jgi:hypothetical protein